MTFKFHIIMFSGGIFGEDKTQCTVPFSGKVCGEFNMKVYPRKSDPSGFKLRQGESPNISVSFGSGSMMSSVTYRSTWGGSETPGVSPRKLHLQESS